MTWLILNIAAAILGTIVGFLSKDRSENMVSGIVGARFGCGYTILQIFLGLVGLAFLLMVGNWLFG